jgi:hypothetical protein
VLLPEGSAPPEALPGLQRRVHASPATIATGRDGLSDELRDLRPASRTQPKDKFETVPIPLPTSAEQAAIAAVLADMDWDFVALEAKLTKARQIKQGMLQELLTGRIRLV